MSRGKPNIHYDRGSGVLSIEVKRAKSVDSDVQEKAAIDYDRRGNIVRINLYRFSFDAFRKGRKAIRSFARRSGVPVAAR